MERGRCLQQLLGTELGAGQLWDCLFTKTTRYKAALGTHIMDGSRSHQVSREWGFQQSLVNVVPGARSVLVSVR